MQHKDFHAFTKAIFTNPTFGEAPTTLADKVDRLGQLAAEAAAIKKESDQLRAELEAAGLKTIAGNMYRATFSQCQGRAVTDWQAIAAKFKPSRQLIAAHTTTSSEFTRMTIKAHPTH